jgi:lipoyl(octanoyl) transferase
MPEDGTPVLHACHVGALGYADGLALQERLVAARAAGETGDWLIYPDHPPVLTVGRGASGNGIRADRATLDRLGVPVFEVSRGGDVTWHGPGQLVGYPIVDLSAQGRDLHRFLRGLERSLIAALGRFGIEGRVIAGRTGVWVQERKIASIGIAVRRWVSYHGFALNVAPDLGFFDLIHPCGLRGIEMASMSLLLGQGCPTMDEVREIVTGELAAELGYKEWCWAQIPGPRTGGGRTGHDATVPSRAGVHRAA